ncbi:MAG: hypothetical protein Q8Q07_02230 [Dehalococcoidales bacterium]|nr:hypothetical protein [Dehalococcoidales bacterium]
MERNRKHYQKPEVTQVSLVPEEAVLEVCKNHEVDTNDPAQGDPYRCSWPAGVGGGVCRGVSGS